MAVSAVWFIQSRSPRGAAPRARDCISHTARDCHAISIIYPQGVTMGWGHTLALWRYSNNPAFIATA